MKLTKSGQSNFSEQPPRRRICTSWIVPLSLLWMLPAGLGLMLAGRASAQTFTTLYSFDWVGPYAEMVLSGNTLYGTARGGAFDTVFAINTDGTGFTNIYSVDYTREYGEAWLSGLILSGNTLYGNAVQSLLDPMEDGSFFEGFAVNTDGTGFTNIYSFTSDSDVGGLSRLAGLILSGNTLYGTGYWGGPLTAMAPCLPSTRMARVLRTCILSRRLTTLPKPTATELVRMPD
jgi:hypothetical protein